MNFEQLFQARITAIQQENSIIRSPSRESHVVEDKSEVSYVFKCTKKEFKKLDMRAMKFFVKKPTKLVNTLIKEKQTSESPTNISTAAFPNTPKVMKACKFISSLNSSMTDKQSNASSSLRLSMSPKSRPTVAGDKSLSNCLKGLKIKFIKSNCDQSMTSGTKARCFAKSEERKLRLAEELKRPYIMPTPPVRSRLPDSNEWLHNQYIQFKCTEDVKTATKSLGVLWK